MGWTEERVERLKELWNEGMSASKIAKELGGVTRNAVIGKVHRLGLSNRTAPAAAAAPEEEAAPADTMARSEAQPAVAPVEVAAPESAPEPVSLPQRREPVFRDASQPRPPGLPTPEEENARATLAEIEKMARKLTLLELTERTCKWPIGDPNDDDFHFCGLPAVAGKPYCEHHVGIAFQPMSTRRDRARSNR
ncbi:MAG: GcrA family cell cycle regulator [Pseudomonadota bacterium]